MGTGAITGYIDVAQIALYVFWVFFAGLIYYLLQENKREGYPLESERSGHVRVQGWPPIPAPKTYLLRDGSTRTVPNDIKSKQPLAAVPTGNWLGAPLMPTGNPMLDGVGPGAWADRPDVADVTLEGAIKIVPLRAAPDFDVASGDPDPRGLTVYGADGIAGGTIVDVWVDRSEMLFRYLELDVAAQGGTRRVLLPINFTRISNAGVRVQSILGDQFALVPGTAKPEQVTLLEEEKIMAYYGGGVLYATAARQEPLL
ncbi:MAG: photosynthetic reaction center subunit H [Bdellovibrionales bacterium]|nr:photosynthetic reaction center subunit H [Ramlibacter sp.]